MLARRDEIDARLAPPSLADHGDGVLRKTRFHGDYHLGQVLVTERDYVIVDFEGEPARPLDERRAKSSPLRDVAGMLRSINYAAVAGMRGIASDRAGDVSALEPLAGDWERRSVDAFLASYRTTLASSGDDGPDAALSRKLLDLFVLEKAFYEMSYELANRPSWVRIPLEGIRSILEPGDAAELARA